MIIAKELLTHFNINEQEADLYLAALELGVTSVNELAKKTHKSRTATYFHIDHLIEKGLLKQTRKEKKTRLVATPPAEVVAKIDRWTTELKSLLPVLESLEKVRGETPVIEIAESRHGYVRVLDEVSSLPPGSSVRVLEGKKSLASELGFLTPDEWSAFFTRMIERRIETHGLFTEASLAVPGQMLDKKNADLLAQRRWRLRSISDQVLPFENLLAIYGDKAAFLFPENGLSLTIQHPSIVNVLRTMFDGLYTLGKPIEKAWAS